MERFKEYNVTILEHPGPTEGQGMVARLIGAESPSKGRNTWLWNAAKGVCFTRDPDGYRLEVAQQ